MHNLIFICESMKYILNKAALPHSLMLCTFDCDATILIYRNVTFRGGGGVKVTSKRKMYMLMQ